MNNILFFTSAILVVTFALLALQRDKSVLIAWIALQSVLANLFVLKQISLFGLNATASDVFAIGSLLGLNLLREKYGQEEGLIACKNAIAASFFCMTFFAITSQIHLLYEPSVLDSTQGAFAQILTPNPRILVSSIFAFFSVQIFDLYFYSFLKRTVAKNNIILLNSLSLGTSQLIDTILFTFLGLYGYVSNIFEIILISYIIKMLAIATIAPFSYFATQRHKATL